MKTHNTRKYQDKPAKVDYPHIQSISHIEVYNEGDYFMLEFHTPHRTSKILYQLEIEDIEALALASKIFLEYNK